MSQRLERRSTLCVSSATSPRLCGESRSPVTQVKIVLEELSKRAWPLCFTALSLLFSSCGGTQSALNPTGPKALSISRLWWLMFYVCTAVFILVLVAMLWAVFHARRKPDRTLTELPATDEPILAPVPAEEQRMTRVVIGAVIVTIAILFVFLITSFFTGRAVTAPMASEQSAVTIEVVGHQWWWEVKYDDLVPSQRFTTANEIHIPVGQPVLVRLNSRDVIHSFWIPNLQGKKDLIPGKPAELWLQADRAGTYRGQCAEFCGHQHAKMAFIVVAEPFAQFDAWRTAQRQQAAAPANERELRGQQVFLSATCIMCHAIHGTQAGATEAPDLTHFASRQTIAAASLPNTRGHLAGWIVDSQGIKPGNHMPPNSLNPEDLQALLDYLESLK
jgi:cytochrome c oxidase subunit 2